MKRNLLFTISLIMVAIGTSLVSCMKQDNPVLAGIQTNQLKTPLHLNSGTALHIPTTGGFIVDYSADSTVNIRTLRTVLNANSFTISDSISGTNLSGNVAQIELTFYVTGDGVIPSGVYSFTSFNTNTPFTFSSGTLIKAINSADNKIVTNNDFVKGTISVTQNANNYQFAISAGLLSNYEKLTASFTGPVVYLDESK